MITSLAVAWIPETLHKGSWRYGLQPNLTGSAPDMAVHNAIYTQSGDPNLGIAFPVEHSMCCCYCRYGFRLFLFHTKSQTWSCALQIRSQLAVEFIEDLRDVSEENSTLLRESLVTSLSMSFDSLPVAEKPVANKDRSISAESKDRSSPV